ncbi:hypothetical protein ISREJYDI_CDS0021 [Pseudomonas phage UNO-G1W1]|uniref:Uncharacterized protein n=1 Tax=Pseudomonas phage UNO-G1W1 TaxID=3136609 RepID=A0AAX4QM27_9CAUD
MQPLDKNSFSGITRTPGHSFDRLKILFKKIL